MKNKFGIPVEVEKRIRRRDTTCVYCNKKMIYPFVGNKQRNWATIEHFREKGPFYWDEGLKEKDLAICCGSCNSSRGKKKIRNWFQSQFCLEKNINEKTVAKPVQTYIKINEK